MRIALILTGGTILSEEKTDCYALSENKKSEILSLIPCGFEAEVFSPYTILSEQLDGDYLNMFIDEVDKRLKDCFDGIMIFHGTDTLQFSAAALSLAFGNSDIPIVLVSSNYVLDDERSNGRTNILYGARFIEQRIGGVFVSYKNTGEKPSIYLGDSLLPHLPFCDTLYSIHGAYGYFEGDEFVKLIGEHDVYSIGKYTLDKHSPVLWLKSTAGMSLPDTSGFKAIMIEAYHSGTLPTENESLRKLCTNSGLPVYVTGVSEGKRYSSTLPYKELGLNILSLTSPILAYIVLWQKFSQ